jgi:hypothetical protein
MRLIGELLREAQASNSKDPPYFMRAADKQELREQWILGRFAGNYNKIAPRNMKYAKHLNPPEPDFEVFDDGKHWILDAEVTEALDADRKRDLELRRESKGFKFVPENDYFPVLQQRISSKCSKSYSRDTILIIYFNIFSSLYDLSDSPGYFNKGFFSSLQIPQKCGLSQIWLLESDCSKILQLA